jgi:uncharacterized protein GlcG (DUF336 family)
MNQAVSRTIPLATISRASSDTLIAAALELAAEAGFEVAVAVADAGGALKGLSRTDGAAPMTADVAIGKAWTSATSGFPTHVWNEIVADPKVAPLTHLPRMMAIAGGIPVIEGGQVVGAIGISGGSHDQDLYVASTALERAGFTA